MMTAARSGGQGAARPILAFAVSCHRGPGWHDRDVLRRLGPWLVYPVVVGGGIAIGIVAIARGAAPAIVVGGLGAAAMVVVAVLERVLPFVPDWNRSRDDVVPDALHTLVSSIGVTRLVDLALLAALAGVAPWLAGAAGVATWPAAWPLVAQLALALVVGELGQYWAHRLLHERPRLWRVHELHHSAERMYWLNGGKNHPLDVAWQVTWLYAPLVVLGAGADVLALVALVPAIHTPLQHSNVAARCGPLSYVFSTCELHRWHHAPGAVGNANYGGNLALWDLVFRSFHRPPRESTTVGLAGAPAYPRRYLAHLLSPWALARPQVEDVESAPTVRTTLP